MFNRSGTCAINVFNLVIHCKMHLHINLPYYGLEAYFLYINTLPILFKMYTKEQKQQYSAHHCKVCYYENHANTLLSIYYIDVIIVNCIGLFVISFACTLYFLITFEYVTGVRALVFNLSIDTELYNQRA